MYPITGHWIWGGGFLQSMGMFDFAGSSVVHSVGGWSALAGVLLLGSRYGKFRADGSVNPIMGHNMSMVTLGGLVLWFGWFGFNPGSTMGVGDGSAIAHIAVTTNTAAATAILSSAATSWLMQKKPDLSMIINGALAGLVAITASCAFVSVGSSAVIGLLAGILVVLAVILFDRMKVDDPVGALSVHLVNGVFGTLAVGLFAQDKITGTATGNGLFFGGGVKLLAAQAFGVVAVGVFTFVVAFAVWHAIKAVIGLRVSREEEIAGLDIGEHGMKAYPDFQGFLTK
jgi:Amt family ammonium transporter